MSLKDDWKNQLTRKADSSDPLGTWICMRVEHAITNVHTPDVPDSTQTTR